MKNGRFKKGLEAAPDWNVSRSRFWGAPMPVWKCADCEQVKVVGSVKELNDFASKDTNYDLHRPDIDQVKFECACGGEMTRITDVFDCWFESGSMPFASKHYPFEHKKDFKDNLPARFISEYIAQTRGWFYTLHILSTALFKQPAFLNAVTTGTIMAEDGSKMSKSKNNFPDPMILINQQGADALRLYLMASNVMAGEKINFSVEEVKTVTRNIILRLWNAYSFFVTYARIDKWSTNVGSKISHILDWWILSRLETLIKNERKLMDSYQVMAAAREFESFINELTNWYIRRSRRRFWKSESDEDKNQAYQTLYTVLVRLTRVLAPFTPFLAEAIYQNLTGQESVHLSDYPEAKADLINIELENEMARVLLIVRLALNARNQAGLKIRQPLAVLKVLGRAPKNQSLIELIKDEINAKQVDFISHLPDFVSKTVVLNLPVLGKKYGSDLAKIKQAVLDNKFFLLKSGKLKLADFVLNKIEFSFKYNSKKDNWLVSGSGESVILLNTELNQDLIQEGELRDLIRQLQEARKKQGLAVDDRVVLVFDQTCSVKDLIAKFEIEIKKEVLVKEIRFAKAEKGIELELFGKNCFCNLAKVK